MQIKLSNAQPTQQELRWLGRCKKILKKDKTDCP